jgi:hypothetical protein
MIELLDYVLLNVHHRILPYYGYPWFFGLYINRISGWSVKMDNMLINGQYDRPHYVIIITICGLIGWIDTK